MNKSSLSSKIAAAGIAAAAFGAPAVLFAEEQDPEPAPLLEESAADADLTDTAPVTAEASGTQTGSADSETAMTETPAAPDPEEAESADPAADAEITVPEPEEPVTETAEDAKIPATDQKAEEQKDPVTAPEAEAAAKTPAAPAEQPAKTAEAEEPVQASAPAAVQAEAQPAAAEQEATQVINIDTNSLTWEQFVQYTSTDTPQTLVFSAGQANLNDPWVGYPKNCPLVQNKTFIIDGNVVLNLKNYRVYDFLNCTFRGANPDLIDTDQRDILTIMTGWANDKNPKERLLSRSYLEGNTNLENLAFGSYVSAAPGTMNISGHVYFQGGYKNPIPEEQRSQFSEQYVGLQADARYSVQSPDHSLRNDDVTIQGITPDAAIYLPNGFMASPYATTNSKPVTFTLRNLQADATVPSDFPENSGNLFTVLFDKNVLENCTITANDSQKDSGVSFGGKLTEVINCTVTALNNGENGIFIGKNTTVQAENSVLNASNNHRAGILGTGENNYALNSVLSGKNLTILANNNGSDATYRDFKAASGIANVSLNLSGDDPEKMLLQINGNNSYGLELRGNAGDYTSNYGINSKFNTISGYRIECNNNHYAGMLISLNDTGGYIQFDKCDIEILRNGASDTAGDYHNTGIWVMPYNVRGDSELIIRDSNVNIAGSPYGITITPNGKNLSILRIQNTDSENRTQMTVQGTVMDIYVNQKDPSLTHFIIEGGNIVSSAPITFDQYMKSPEHYGYKVDGYPENLSGQHLYRFDFTGAAGQSGAIEYTDANGNKAQAPFVFDENGKASVWLPAGVMIFDGNGGLIDGKAQTGFVVINGQSAAGARETAPDPDTVLLENHVFKDWSPNYDESAPILGEVMTEAQWVNANAWKTEPSINDWIYGETPSEPSGEAEHGDVTFLYGTSENGPFTTEKPTAAGTYYLKAEAAQTEDYGGLTKVIPFHILKAPDFFLQDLAVEDIVHGETPNPTAAAKSGAPVRFLYAADPDGEFRKEIPMDAGQYFVKAVTDDSDNYTGAESSVVGFQIRKAPNSWIEGREPSIKDWNFSETPSVPDAAAKFGTPVFSYASRQDGPFSAKTPDREGTYYLRAYVPEDRNHEGLDTVIIFRIHPKQIVTESEAPAKTEPAVTVIRPMVTLTEETPAPEPVQTQTSAEPADSPDTATATQTGFFATLASLSAAAVAVLFSKRRK